MKILCFDTAEALAKAAAGEIASLLRQKPDCVLGLATGSTPEDTYAELVRMYKEEGLDFSKATSYNLDEYVGLDPAHPQSYRTFMNVHLFDLVNIDKAKTHIPDGNYASGEAYDAAIAKAGGVDLQVLGIGRNGHIGFNEPGETLVTGTHEAILTEDTREANARFFDSIDEVPKSAMSMGMGSIFAARKILLLALGEGKREAVRSLLDDKVTCNIPATLLKLHPDVTVLCDRAALGE